MNIFKFFNKHGKIALSAMQAVGLTAVVGVAGVAAFQILGTSEEDNTAFNPASYNPGEVVYVAGANTGGYQSGSYGGNGAASGPLANISAKSINRIDRQAQLDQAQAEMEEEYAQMQATAQESAAPQTQTGYQMGSSEGGLGLLSNAANEEALASNPMAAMGQAMGNIQGAIANAQAQAQAQAEGNGAAGKAGGLASATPDWGSKFGGGNGGAGGTNMSFSMQDSGKNVRKGANGAVAGGPAMDMSAIQAQAAQMLEGARIKGKSSFGVTEGTGKYRNASVGEGRRLDGAGSDLEFARKTSAAVANSKNRSANEGARAFLASRQLSGGLMITSENFQTGSGQGSKDFENDSQVNLRGIKTWEKDLTVTETEHDSDRNKMAKSFWRALMLTAVACMTILVIGKSWPWGTIAAIALCAWTTLRCTDLIVSAARYADKWGGGAASTWFGIGGIAMICAMGAAWVFPGALAELYGKLVNLVGISADLVGVGAIAGAEGIGAGSGSFKKD